MMIRALTEKNLLLRHTWTFRERRRSLCRLPGEKHLWGRCRKTDVVESHLLFFLYVYRSNLRTWGPFLFRLGMESTSILVFDCREIDKICYVIVFNRQEVKFPSGTWHNEVYISPGHAPATFFTRLHSKTKRTSTPKLWFVWLWKITHL